MPTLDPATLIQQQLEAYNAKDVDGWLATYAPDAVQYTLHGGMLASGHAELRARIEVRFQEPNLYARLLSRTVMDNIVVDYEEVTRNFPDGIGTIEMLCIYEVQGGKIHKASFAMGRPRLHPV
ncbi:MAG: nuclear transport factor 2 family protein [Burkholderiales bacterium]|nr:nuclear transport factor 2 family protein [Burkholderiales bacterium]